jgi:hypothetical protein
MAWTFYNASGEILINDGGVLASAAVFTGKVDLGSNLLVGNAGSTGIAISANGEVTMANQPAVLAYNSAADSNVTGNGTTVTVDFDTEIFDQNADFATDTFTAPVTGRYQVSFSISFSGLTASARPIEVRLATSNRTYICAYGSANTGYELNTVSGSILADMDATDTFTITGRIRNESSDVCEIEGGTSLQSRVSVRLAA